VLARLVSLPVLLLLCACAGGLQMAGPITVKQTGREPREIYEHGQRMLKAGFYDKAIADYQELRNFHRDDPLSVRGELALAEIRFRKAEYAEARFAFEEFAQYHPRHDSLDYVTYMIGLCVWKEAPRIAGRDQSLTRQAVTRWSGFDTRFPESEYVDEVGKYMVRGVDRLAAKDLWVARFYAKRRAWAAVEGRSATIQAMFPDSRHAEEAVAMRAMALHATGRAEEARATRDELVARWPESGAIRRVDRALARPPGVPPEEVVFIRPYRVPAGLPPQQAQAGPGR
jgi:outer membrane protein assembly factor BamD